MSNELRSTGIPSVLFCTSYPVVFKGGVQGICTFATQGKRDTLGFLTHVRASPQGS